MRLRFSGFDFDSEARQLSRGGAPVHLEPKAFDLLELLLERRPAAVAKAAIRDRLWSQTFVSESSLTTLAAQLRRALGEAGRRVRTVHGFGYAFDGEVASLDASSSRLSATAGTAVGPCLVWQGQTYPLPEGESVLGRDPAADMLVDVPGVSRRHARVVVTGGEAVVEDLESKNGTFIGDRRVDRPMPLADRDPLRLGGTVLVYRCARRSESTETEVP